MNDDHLIKCLYSPGFKDNRFVVITSMKVYNIENIKLTSTIYVYILVHSDRQNREGALLFCDIPNILCYFVEIFTSA